jgi:hypothetical protein
MGSWSHRSSGGAGTLRDCRAALARDGVETDVGAVVESQMVDDELCAVAV